MTSNHHLMIMTIFFFFSTTYWFQCFTSSQSQWALLPRSSQLAWLFKISLHSSVQWLHHVISFWLPSHKADPTFEGSQLIIQKVHDSPDLYLAFIKCLACYFLKNIMGQSRCDWVVLNLTINGVPPPLIQAADRWSSEAFWAYTQMNPFFLHALLFGRWAEHDHP